MSSIRRWEPFRGMLSIQRDLDRMFDEFLGRPMMRWESEGVRTPTVDVAETADEVVVTAEVPGIERKHLEVEVLPESLALKAEMSKESEEKDSSFHRRERVWGRYERTIPLPTEVVSDKAQAKLKDGVLTVRVPKTERARSETPTRVKVE